MSLSLSSILASFCQCLIIVVIQQLILTFESKKILLSPKLLYFISGIFLIRIMLPIEISSLTITLPSRIFLPNLSSFLNFNLFKINGSIISLKQALILLSMIITCLKLYAFFYKNKEFKKELSLLPIVSKNSFEYKNRTYDYKIVRSPLVNSPCIYGFRSFVVMLSDEQRYSDKELDYIFFHEFYHIKNYDNIFVFLVEILVCFFWWNPLIILFKKQINKILELRVDSELVNKFSDHQAIEYAECILKVARDSLSESSNIITNDKIPISNFVSFKEGFLEKRIQQILSLKRIHSTRKIIVISTLFISVFPLLFIVEPYTVDKRTEDTTFKIDNSEKNYLIENNDGTYSLYINNKYKSKIQNIKNFPESSKMKIYRRRKK